MIHSAISDCWKQHRTVTTSLALTLRINGNSTKPARYTRNV